MTIKRSFYTQATDYEIPTDKVVNVTIVGTFQNTKIYVEDTLVKMLASADNGVGTDYWSTFNAEAYAERFGGNPALNTGDLKRHPAWKATDGDVSDPNTYWLSSNNNADYLMVDLGETKTVSKVAVTWNGTQYATAFHVEAMSDFGDYASAYFTDGNAGATPELPELTEEDLGYLATMQAKIADDKDSIYYGSSLLLKSDTILRHYFTEEVPGSTQKGSLYYIDSEGIPAHELGEERVTEVGDIEITYNPLSYAYIALTREGIEESLTSLMRAMYQYHQAAQAYLEATPN